MTAFAWSTLGLLAVALGVLATALLSGLGRIDALGARLDGRIDALGADLRADIREVRQAVQSLDQRLTRAGG